MINQQGVAYSGVGWRKWRASWESGKCVRSHGHPTAVPPREKVTMLVPTMVPYEDALLLVCFVIIINWECAHFFCWSLLFMWSKLIRLCDPQTKKKNYFDNVVRTPSIKMIVRLGCARWCYDEPTLTVLFESISYKDLIWAVHLARQGR
jgi:hypothetical protein